MGVNNTVLSTLQETLNQFKVLDDKGELPWNLQATAFVIQELIKQLTTAGDPNVIKIELAIRQESKDTLAIGASLDAHSWSKMGLATKLCIMDDVVSNMAFQLQDRIRNGVL